MRRFSRRFLGLCAAVACAVSLDAQTPAPRATSAGTGVTAPSFVRINGVAVPLRYAYALTAPDGFEPSEEVVLVLITPTAIAPEVLAKVASRKDVFGLMAQGAVVEIRKNGHAVFIYHKTLGEQRLQTGGDSTFTATPDRAAGVATTFMPGDETSFGYKVRYELTFDTPIAKRLPLEKGSGPLVTPIAAPAPPPAPTPPAPAPAPRATSAPARPSPPPAPAVVINWKSAGPFAPHTAAEATRLLARPGTTTTIDEHFWDGITQHEPQRLALALQAGADVKQLRPVVKLTPLVIVADRCDMTRDVEAQISITDQLIAAGADLLGVDSTKANALTLAADDCPLGVVKALINAKLPLQAVSAVGMTPLKAAITADRVDVVDALLDAGLDQKKEPYNVGRWASGKKEIEAALKKKRKSPTP